jgi:hypothetical protein
VPFVELRSVTHIDSPSASMTAWVFDTDLFGSTTGSTAAFSRPEDDGFLPMKIAPETVTCRPSGRTRRQVAA